MIGRMCRGMLALAVAFGSLGSVAVYGADASAPVAAYSPLHLKAMGGERSGGVGALASSALDAVALPTSPVAATLASQGASRLYSVNLAAGDRLSLSITAPVGEFDVYVYAPGLGLLSSATAIAHASEGRYPRACSYDVPGDISGTYYIEVYAYDGFGDYTLDWAVTPGAERARKDIGAAEAVTLPIDRTVTIPDALQASELYRFYVAGGRRVTVDLAGPANADFDLYLYAPGTASVLPTYVQPVASGNGGSANESFVFDVPVGASGLYYLELIRFNGSGDARLQVTQSLMPAAPSAGRVAGADRFATAVAVAQKTHPAGSRTAVLCSGRSFPDGLAASSLAGALSAPVLLTEKLALPAVVGAQLAAMNTDTVYVIGGSAAIGFAVETDLARHVPGVSIIRVAGATRYETAGEVADWVHGVLGQRPDRVFLASGTAFPDALALSPLAYSMHVPILLTAQDALPTSTKAAIERMRGASARTIDVVVAGGTSAVSVETAEAARRAAGGTFIRAAGANRYETALAIAETAVIAGWAAPEFVAVASGITFPDSLGGASLPGSRGGVLLLCPSTVLGTSSTGYIKSFDFRIDECWALGGTRAVADPVLTEVRAILPKVPHTH